MRITDILSRPNLSLSFEIFPPKTTDSLADVKEIAAEIAALSPSYMSVTYGAGGTNAGLAEDVASFLLSKNIPTLFHLSCVTATQEQIHSELTKLKALGIENILALRGDIPQGFSKDNLQFHYASELISEITPYQHFCIGGACYPETHPESASSFEDIRHLKEKVDAGCQFLTTQMFFDNNIYYNFVYRLREAGINVPVVAGIMPVTNPSSIKRICAISGTALPQRFIRIVDKFGDNPESMRQAGIAYATEQIIDLYANGVKAVHVYSMNKPSVAKAIHDNVSSIIG